MKDIKSYFKGVGLIELSEVPSFRVSAIEDIANVIIPHFDKYPLISQKKADFELFKRAVYIIRKGSLTEKDIQEIVNIKAILNLGLSEKLKEAFPNTTAVVRPLVSNQEIPDPNWISGFASGDGNFSINITKSSTCKVGFSVKLAFNLYQHVRDKELMINVSKYLGCGSVVKDGDAMVSFSVYNISYVINIIIPMFKQYPIRGVKALDFGD